MSDQEKLRYLCAVKLAAAERSRGVVEAETLVVDGLVASYEQIDTIRLARAWHTGPRKDVATKKRETAQ